MNFLEAEIQEKFCGPWNGLRVNKQKLGKQKLGKESNYETN